MKLKIIYMGNARKCILNFYNINLLFMLLYPNLYLLRFHEQVYKLLTKISSTTQSENN